MHEFRKFNTECPAYGEQCHKCKRIGHFNMFKAFCTASHRENRSTDKPHSMKKMGAEKEETFEDYNEEYDEDVKKRGHMRV